MKPCVWYDGTAWSCAFVKHAIEQSALLGSDTHDCVKAKVCNVLKGLKTLGDAPQDGSNSSFDPPLFLHQA
jgi:hypothetical protein